jgi:hypothetical protein
VRIEPKRPVVERAGAGAAQDDRLPQPALGRHVQPLGPVAAAVVEVDRGRPA